MPAGADDSAGRTAGFCGAFNVDPALAEAQNFRFQDTVVGQVKDRGGSVRARGSKLGQGS
jgi:hypothetical protein